MSTIESPDCTRLDLRFTNLIQPILSRPKKTQHKEKPRIRKKHDRRGSPLLGLFW